MSPSFRNRMPEWVLAAGLLLWGILVCMYPIALTTESSHIITAVVSPFGWGIIAIIAGLIRLIFLIINGAWRPSAHIRAIGSIISASLCGAIVVSTITSVSLIIVTVPYVILLVLDLISLWFSAEDAKLADLRAKSRLKK